MSPENAVASRRPTFLWPIYIAAAILLLIGFWFFNSNPKAETIRAAATENVDTVKLPDQSVVTLNKHSEIQYPQEFGKNSRKVNLISGEAFFAVTKNTERPFIVHASFSDITVVGTEFNVRSSGDVVEVGVSEGLVLVVTSSDSTYVQKGSSFVFRKSQNASPAAVDENTWAYATRRLVFKDTPMGEVIEAVEKTYSVSISVSNDNIKKCTLNTTFDQYSVDKILLLISETLNLKLEQNGQVYTLEGEGCP